MLSKCVLANRTITQVSILVSWELQLTTYPHQRYSCQSCTSAGCHIWNRLCIGFFWHSSSTNHFL